MCGSVVQHLPSTRKRRRKLLRPDLGGYSGSHRTPGILEAEGGGLRVTGQPGLQSKTLPQKNQELDVAYSVVLVYGHELIVSTEKKTKDFCSFSNSIFIYSPILPRLANAKQVSYHNPADIRQPLRRTVGLLPPLFFSSVHLLHLAGSTAGFLVTSLGTPFPAPAVVRSSQSLHVQ